MSSFDDYYNDLAAWEQKPVLPLIEAWDSGDVQNIVNEFRTAFQACSFATTLLPIPPGTTNQSIGNKVAEFFTNHMNRHLKAFRIEDCSGAGYPDKQLREVGTGRLFICEIKATSHFNPNDSNRIVLTSSSEKLRRKFRPPLHHLLVTACYVDHNGQLELRTSRLDFLEPTTPVNVRLEASVSQRLLAQAAHRNFTFWNQERPNETLPTANLGYWRAFVGSEDRRGQRSGILHRWPESCLHHRTSPED